MACVLLESGTMWWQAWRSNSILSTYVSRKAGAPCSRQASQGWQCELPEHHIGIASSLCSAPSYRQSAVFSIGGRSLPLSVVGMRCGLSWRPLFLWRVSCKQRLLPPMMDCCVVA